MAEEQCFDVVLFLDTGAPSDLIAITHESWKEEGEAGDMLCYWPKKDPTGLARKKAKPIRDSPFWKLHRVKIIAHGKTYKKARAISGYLEEHTDFNTTSSSEVNDGKRKRKLPAKLREDEPSTTSDGAIKKRVANRGALKQRNTPTADDRIFVLFNDEQGQTFSSSQSCKNGDGKRADVANVFKELNSSRGDSGILVPHDENQEESFMSINGTSSSCSLAFPLDCSSPKAPRTKNNINLPCLNASSSAECNDEYLQNSTIVKRVNEDESNVIRRLASDLMGFRGECLRHFKELNNQFKHLKDEVGNLKQILEGKENGKTEIVEDIISHPFETKEDLLSFDSGLSGNVLGKQRLVNALRNVGGSKLEESIRLMMRKIGSNQVWEEYCLTGNNKDKEVFQDLRIYRCIRKACLLAYPERKDGPKVCRGVISTYLTQSTHHKGGAVFQVRKKTDVRGQIRVMKRNRTPPPSSDEEED